MNFPSVLERPVLISARISDVFSKQELSAVIIEDPQAFLHLSHRIASVPGPVPAAAKDNHKPFRLIIAKRHQKRLSMLTALWA